jgi:hypothetical protein
MPQRPIYLTLLMHRGRLLDYQTWLTFAQIHEDFEKLNEDSFYLDAGH